MCFCFRQKTAYEMRISDWSSDVCSSDLILSRALEEEGYRVATAGGGREGIRMAREVRPAAIILDIIMPDLDGWSVLHSLKTDDALSEIPVILVTVLADRDMGLALGAADRSEAHTSELQSLMRISYAVFCLQKKNITQP